MLKKLFCAVILISVLLCGCNGGAVTSVPSSESTGNYYVGDIIDGDVFSYPVEGGTKTASVQCKSKTVELEFSYAGPNTQAPTLKVDGNLVAIDECWAISSAQVLDNVILLVVNTGGDVTSMNFYAIDTAGNILFHIHELNNNGMYLTNFNIDQYGYIFYRLEGDRLIFQGTRRFHGPSIFVGTDQGYDEIELTDDNGNLIVDQVGIPDGEVVDRQYEMQYLGNGKFGPLTESEITMTYGEFKQTLTD